MADAGRLVNTLADSVDAPLSVAAARRLWNIDAERFDVPVSVAAARSLRDADADKVDAPASVAAAASARNVAAERVLAPANVAAMLRELPPLNCRTVLRTTSCSYHCHRYFWASAGRSRTGTAPSADRVDAPPSVADTKCVWTTLPDSVDSRSAPPVPALVVMRGPASGRRPGRPQGQPMTRSQGCSSTCRRTADCRRPKHRRYSIQPLCQSPLPGSSLPLCC